MTTQKTDFLLDTHLHLYSKFSISKLFDHCCESFSSFSKNRTTSAEFVTFYVRSEKEPIADEVLIGKHDSWAVVKEQGLYHASSAGRDLYVVPGQQLNTIEGLEVLSIAGGSIDFSPKLSLKELLHEIQNLPDTPIVILPWGFGKWLGKKSNPIKEAIVEFADKVPLYVGDIPARTSLLGGAEIINNTRVNTLRGVDPLPMNGEEQRVGSYGTLVTIELAESMSAFEKVNALIESLKNKNSTPIKFSQFGKRLSLFSNIKSQVLLRVVK